MPRGIAHQTHRGYKPGNPITQICPQCGVNPLLSDYEKAYKFCADCQEHFAAINQEIAAKELIAQGSKPCPHTPLKCQGMTVDEVMKLSPFLQSLRKDR